HELVAAAAARHAGATAVTFGAERASYRELEVRSSRLALHLQGLGAGPEVRVAICLERSVDLVVAILAVLKAGAAYVPLDPAYPRERLAFMLEDSRAAVLLTHTALAPRCPEHAGARVCLDAEAAAIAARPAGAVPARARGDDAAYVLYTSGSTGRPKGVVLPHAALCNLIAWQLAESPAGSA